MKKYIAEFMGTCILSVVVGLSLTNGFSVATPVLAAVTLTLFVYTIGHISGTQLNPAVTLALLSLKKISGKVALVYILFQYLGAFVASKLIPFFTTTPSVVVGISAKTGLAEALGALIFTFGICAVVRGRVAPQLTGVIVGGSLLLGIALAATAGSNGILNPAVALAIGSHNMQYLLGPIFGAILGMQLFNWLDGGKSK